MATIGLRDLYRAPITIGTDGAEDYGTPRAYGESYFGGNFR